MPPSRRPRSSARHAAAAATGSGAVHLIDTSPQGAAAARSTRRRRAASPSSHPPRSPSPLPTVVRMSTIPTTSPVCDDTSRPPLFPGSTGALSSSRPSRLSPGTFATRKGTFVPVTFVSVTFGGASGVYPIAATASPLRGGRSARVTACCRPFGRARSVQSEGEVAVGVTPDHGCVSDERPALQDVDLLKVRDHVVDRRDEVVAEDHPGAVARRRGGRPTCARHADDLHDAPLEVGQRAKRRDHPHGRANAEDARQRATGAGSAPAGEDGRWSDLPATSPSCRRRSSRNSGRRRRCRTERWRSSRRLLDHGDHGPEAGAIVEASFITSLQVAFDTGLQLPCSRPERQPLPRLGCQGDRRPEREGRRADTPAADTVGELVATPACATGGVTVRRRNADKSAFDASKRKTSGPSLWPSVFRSAGPPERAVAVGERADAEDRHGERRPDVSRPVSHRDAGLLGVVRVGVGQPHALPVPLDSLERLAETKTSDNRAARVEQEGVAAVGSPEAASVVGQVVLVHPRVRLNGERDRSLLSPR